jgi:hypothetical protein
MFNDPFAGIEVVNGELAVPDAIGCGVEPVDARAKPRTDVA